MSKNVLVTGAAGFIGSNFAEYMVNKICTYIDDGAKGKWKSQILFLADDGNHGAHVETAEEVAKIIQNKNKDFLQL